MRGIWLRPWMMLLHEKFLKIITKCPALRFTWRWNRRPHIICTVVQRTHVEHKSNFVDFYGAPTSTLLWIIILINFCSIPVFPFVILLTSRKNQSLDALGNHMGSKFITIRMVMKAREEAAVAVAEWIAFELTIIMRRSKTTARLTVVWQP